ncbi:MAG: VTT domain-containing protein [Myxococcales bacterium]|nr:VTT domain-containing protein [Myxococcales bacterium]
MTPPARHVAAIWPRVAVVVLLCAAAVALLVSDALRAPLLRLLAVTQTLIAANPLLGALLFVGFAALSGMVAFFSSAVITPVAVNAWGPVWTALMLWAGWVLGGAGTYAIGRSVGRPVAGLVSPTKLARYEHKITRETPFGLVVLFQMATPSEVPGYLLGMVRYSFLRYIAVVALGELPYAIGTVLLGETFLEQRVLPFVLLGGAAAAFSGWAYFRFQRTRARGGPAPAAHSG